MFTEQQELKKSGVVRHAELIEELNQITEETKRAEVLRIEERSKEVEELNKTREERGIALDLLKIEASQAVDYFEEVAALIAGKNEIHPDVLVAYKEAETTKNGLESAVADLAMEIEKMGAGMVTQEEIERYQALQKRVDELNQELSDIIENPYVLEELFKQEKNRPTA